MTGEVPPDDKNAPHDGELEPQDGAPEPEDAAPEADAADQEQASDAADDTPAPAEEADGADDTGFVELAQAVVLGGNLGDTVGHNRLRGRKARGPSPRSLHI